MPSFTEYSVPTGGSNVYACCVGPDGYVWFTEYSGDKVGKIDPATGTITEYAIAAGSGARHIAVGPDGLLWVCASATNKILKITTSGTVTSYTCPTAGAPFGICSDGTNLWFTYSTAAKVCKITTGGTFTEYSITGFAGTAICLGPDGNLWACDTGNNKIQKVTTGGSATGYTITSGSAVPYGICVGGDGNLWFTEYSTSKVAKITTAGTITEYSLTSGNPYGICAGPDGNLWLTKVVGDKLTQVTTAGTVTDVSLPGANSSYFPCATATAIWYTALGTNKVGTYAPVLGASPSASDSFSFSEASASVTDLTTVTKSASDTVSASDTSTATVFVTSAQGAPLMLDEFVGAAGGLASHTSDSGHTWTDGSIVTNLDGSGNIRTATGGVAAQALSSYQMSGEDLDITFGGMLATGSVGDLTGLLVRADAAASVFLQPYLYHDTAGVYVGLYGSTGGFYASSLVSTVLGSYTADTEYTVRLVLSGATATLYLNGTQVWSGTTTEARTNRRIHSRLIAVANVNHAKITRIEVPAPVAGAPSDSVTVSEGAPSVSDPSIITKSASETASVADAASPVLARIMPAAGGYSQSAWVTRTPNAGAVLVKDGGGTYGNNYPFGARLPNGNLRVWYQGYPGDPEYSDSSDGGATWSVAGHTTFFGTLPANTYAGLTNVRLIDGVYHGTIWYTTIAGTVANYPSGPGWWFEVTGYYVQSADATTWDTPVQVFSQPADHNFDPYDVLKCADGSLLLIGDYYTASTGTWIQTRVYRSTDNGATWALYSTPIASTAEFGGFVSEPQFVRIDDGSAHGVIVLTWALYDADPPMRMFRRSLDGGLTWGTAYSLVRTINHGGIAAMPDGDIVFAAYTAASGAKWFVSRDSGATFTDMGSVLSGTSQPASTGAGGYVANKWLNAFPTAAAGVTPNLAIVWGSGSDDTHGSSYFRSFTRGATAAPVVSAGQGQETVTVGDSAGVTIGVGAVAKTASDGFTVTDTSGGRAITTYVTATDTATVADTAAPVITPSAVVASDTATVFETRIVAVVTPPVMVLEVSEIWDDGDYVGAYPELAFPYECSTPSGNPVEVVTVSQQQLAFTELDHDETYWAFAGGRRLRFTTDPE